jgi:hypothetical protein
MDLESECLLFAVASAKKSEYPLIHIASFHTTTSFNSPVRKLTHHPTDASFDLCLDR